MTLNLDIQTLMTIGIPIVLSWAGSIAVIIWNQVRSSAKQEERDIIHLQSTDANTKAIEKLIELIQGIKEEYASNKSAVHEKLNHHSDDINRLFNGAGCHHSKKSA